MNLHTDSVHLALVQRISARALARAGDDPLIVGICGPQGSGKTTMTGKLRHLLAERGLRAVVVSLDDFYLRRAEREELADSVHPLLRTRGVPGTHDLELAGRVLTSLSAGKTTRLPVFDKALDDRRPPSEWPTVHTRPEVILFEGWCVGAVQEPDASLAQPINVLEREEDPDGVWRRYVNRTLANEYQRLFRRIGLLILLAAPDFEVVYRWRWEQENDLRLRVAAQGGDVLRLMTDEQLERFISHYERLTRHILAEMPARADIVVRLDAQRRKTLL